MRDYLESCYHRKLVIFKSFKPFVRALEVLLYERFFFYFSNQIMEVLDARRIRNCILKSMLGQIIEILLQTFKNRIPKDSSLEFEHLKVCCFTPSLTVQSPCSQW